MRNSTHDACYSVIARLVLLNNDVAVAPPVKTQTNEMSTNPEPTDKPAIHATRAGITKETSYST